MSKYSEDATIKTTARKARKLEAGEAAAEAAAKSQTVEFDYDAMTIIQLRQHAKELGIKLNHDQRTKPTIIAAIEAKRAEEAAKAKPAPTAKKRCANCGTRPRTSESPEGQLCEPCLREAEHENQHSDDDHEGLINRAETAKHANVDNKKSILADLARYQTEIDGCWICHPELNKASVAYVERAGTSRKGIVMTVSLRATGREKAQQVATKLGGGKISSSKGRTVLRHGDLVLVWEANGRFTSEGSKFGKRAIRNASEALRLVGATQAA